MSDPTCTWHEDGFYYTCNDCNEECHTETTKDGAGEWVVCSCCDNSWWEGEEFSADPFNVESASPPKQPEQAR